MPHRPSSMKLPRPAHLLLRRPLPHPHQPLDERENHSDPRRDAEHVAHQLALPVRRVEEAVDIEALRCAREVCEAEVEREEDDEEWEVDPGSRGGAGEEDLD